MTVTQNSVLCSTFIGVPAPVCLMAELPFCGVAGGIPRTPVRQKMKTMSRSLQMLNVARLNVKAQKFHPDGVSLAVNEKLPQKLSAKRLDEKVEEKEKALKISIGMCYQS